jgi:hypothetical protein
MSSPSSGHTDANGLSNVGLYLSESFAEITVFTKNKKSISKLWYMRSKNLVDGLKEFFDEHKIGEGRELHVSSFWPEMVFQKNLGNPPALLVSAGFEDWLHLRQPKKTWAASLPPERYKSFFSSDYIFGITERTDAEGKVVTAPNLEDLEFLHQKFLLAGIKNVAIGLLHSSKNSANEDTVANFFRSKDYKVWTSLQYSSEGHNEVARWWRAGLEAYISNTLGEMNNPLIELCKERGIKLRLSDFDNLGSCFDIYRRVRDRYKDQADYIMWADLRGFTLLDANSDQKVIETILGPIAATAPHLKQLRLKPTSLVENEGLRGQRNIFFDIGYDPGPMSFGRGVKPTFFDILYSLDFLNVPEGLAEFIKPSSKDKIIQSLAIAMRVLLKNEPRWHEFLAGWARTQFVTEIIEFAQDSKVLIVGPLASSLAKLFEDKELGFQLKIDPETEWLGSMASLPKG